MKHLLALVSVVALVLVAAPSFAQVRAYCATKPTSALSKAVCACDHNRVLPHMPPPDPSDPTGHRRMVAPTSRYRAGFEGCDPKHAQWLTDPTEQKAFTAWQAQHDSALAAKFKARQQSDLAIVNGAAAPAVQPSK